VSRAFSGVLLACLTFGLISCDKMPLMAPTGSSIFLTASTTRLAVNGTADITATVVEQAGTPPQNGTVVRFTSTLGTVDPAEARTDAGRVVVRFVAGSQSGTARVNANSGDARAAADLEIQIGGAAAANVALRADPATVPTSGGTVTLVATVTDDVGNRLPGVPVSFTADSGQLVPGSAITDADGEARSTLTTNRDTAVTARAGSQQGTLTVRAIALPVVTISTTSTDIQAGVPASFTVTPQAGTNANPLREVIVDFGDGTPPTNLGALAAATTFAHTFPRAGTFTITVTATDTQGLVGRTSTVVTVSERSTVPLTVTAAPNPTAISNATQRGITTFTAAVGTLPTGDAVRVYNWEFGDGTSVTTTGNSTSHFYGTPNNYIARVRVTTNQGREGYAEVVVRVLP
jgi:adhesin/invasin